MATETKSEKAARMKSEAAAKRQAAKARKVEPTKAELAARGAQAAAALKTSQPKDDKQARTVGIVARGHCVKDDDGYKGPGMMVRASKEEIEKMRVKGVLVDEGRVALPMGVSGPRVLQEDAAARGAEEG